MPKIPSQITKIRKSCEIAVQVLESVICDLRSGMTEKKVVNLIRRYSKKLGAQKQAFPPIVAFGRNSATPHHKATDRRLRKGDIIKIDLGVVVDGYCSDITRTFFTAQPTKLQREAYEAVRKAQQIGIRKTRAGISGKELDAHVRNYLASISPPVKGGGPAKRNRGVNQSFAKYFIHSLGHGLGKKVHEPPKISPKSKATIKEHDAITIEPGVYLKGRFGVRIEDTVVVKKSDCEILTKFPKKLTILRLK